MNTASSKTDTRPPRDTNAALRGATLAFARPMPRSKLRLDERNRRDERDERDERSERGGRDERNGALVAASQVYAQTRTRGPQVEGGGIEDGITRQHSGTGSVTENPVRHRFLAGNGGTEYLNLPTGSKGRSLSPSYIAATLAASRSAGSPTRKTLFSPSVRSLSRSMDRGRGGDEDGLDTRPIPPTTSLIGLFEKSAGVRASTQSVVGRESESSKWVLPEPSSAEPRRSSKKSALGPKDIDEDSASSNDSFASARDYRPRSGTALPRRPSSLSMDSRTIDAMATAIVASSLASSRVGSPSKLSQNLAPPLPPPRHNSPAKGLRTTMRKPPKADEEDTELVKRGRKNIMKKHPNKHHEGDRKRWRDGITDRERKRYEAVWASNRGLYVHSTPEVFPAPRDSTPANGSSPSNSVSNIVVRDIWSRSRLGPDILSEVWELVDRSRSGRLSKEEFIVGLWLVDQRLKGRKLPVRVGDSVWGSIRGLEGFLVRGRGGRG